jgi:hypothetical protein
VALKYLSVIAGILPIVAMTMLTQPGDFPELSGPYLGQTPPGRTPEIFAPGIVSKEGDQGRLFVSADGSEIIYWERDPANGKMAIISLLSAGEAWSSPSVLPFSLEYINNEPCLSSDGRKLFFVSNI